MPLFCGYRPDKKVCFMQNREMIWDIRFKHPYSYIVTIGEHVVSAPLAMNSYSCRLSNHLLETNW